MKLAAGLASHVPAVEESVLPTTAVPVTAGATVFSGICVTVIEFDAACAADAPPEFVATTLHETAWPISAWTVV